MVKHTQTIRRLLPTNCLSVFDHFVGLVLKVLITCNKNRSIGSQHTEVSFDENKMWIFMQYALIIQILKGLF